MRVIEQLGSLPLQRKSAMVQETDGASVSSRGTATGMVLSSLKVVSLGQSFVTLLTLARAHCTISSCESS